MDLKKNQNQKQTNKQKQDPTICCLWETHFSSKNTHRLKGKGRNTIFPANGIAILLSDKIDFKPKRVTRYKESHYIIIIIKSIHQEDITIHK